MPTKKVVNNLQIIVSTCLYPTEDPSKIHQALCSVIESSSFQVNHANNELKRSCRQVIAQSTKIESLRPIYLKLRSQRILESARKILRKGAYADKVIFFLHKQAASAGQIHFCEEENESPLGPIKVEVVNIDVEWFIDWLTPQTENGKVIREIQPFLRR
ncbi:MAG: RNA-binding domain-containing protein [Candidatus Ranarchaeia archaeon]